MNEQPATTCSNCGAAAPAGAGFCPTCGTSLAATASPPGQQPPGQQPPGTHPPPGRTSLSDQDQRLWSIGAHASAAIGAMIGGIGSFVGPLVVWLIRREDDPYVAAHALEALNFNITVDLIVVAGIILGFVTLGFGFLIVAPLLLVVGILWLVFTIQASMAASRGETYRYPMSIRLMS